jgi:hypothetical protein
VDHQGVHAWHEHNQFSTGDTAMLCLKQLQVVTVGACLMLIPFKSFAETTGDGPAFPLESHVDQFQITNGAIGFTQLFDDSDELLEAPHNDLDSVSANLLQDAAVSILKKKYIAYTSLGEEHV